MATAAASACAVTMIGLLHSFRKYLHKPPVTLPSSRKNLLQPPVKLPCSPFHPSSIYFNSPTSKYPFFPLAVSPLITNRNPSSTTIPPRAKHRSSRKVNIRCRFGGKLMPRPSDGTLHYVGRRTRITDFRRDTTLQELYCKMEDICGGPVVICYKLPDQNLDSLVSISSAEDLDNMLDKYDYLKKTSKCGYPRLQVFLFPLSNRENSLVEFNDAACNESGLSYIEEVNGATKADGFKTYKNDDQEGATSMQHVDDKGDGSGNENTSAPEHQGFLAYSNIKDEINVAPQIVNPPNNVPYVLPSYEEPHQIHYITPSSFAMAHESQPQNHQLYGENFLETSDSNSIFKKPDPWNVLGPSNVDSYFGHFRHAKELSTDEADENLHNLIEIVESVLQSPYMEELNGATKDDGFKTYKNDNKEGTTSMLHVDDRGDGNGISPFMFSFSFNSSLIDILGNDNTSVPEHQSFLAHSNINDEINVAPQIVNPPNNMPYILPTYEEPHQIHYITPSSFAMAHEPQQQNYQLYGESILETSDSNSIFKNQDPWNVPDPSNIDSYFGHFRHTQEVSTDEADEDLHNLIELVESVLQSP